MPERGFGSLVRDRVNTICRRAVCAGRERRDPHFRLSMDVAVGYRTRAATRHLFRWLQCWCSHHGPRIFDVVPQSCFSSKPSIVRIFSFGIERLILVQVPFHRHPRIETFDDLAVGNVHRVGVVSSIEDLDAQPIRCLAKIGDLAQVASVDIAEDIAPSHRRI